MTSGKHDTQSDAKDVNLEASFIDAIESDVNMNNNCGKEDQQLQYEKQNNGGGIYCITSHLTNSYSVLGDQDSRLNENSLLHPATHSFQVTILQKSSCMQGYIPYLHVYYICFIVVPTG